MCVRYICMLIDLLVLGVRWLLHGELYFFFVYHAHSYIDNNIGGFNITIFLIIIKTCS